MSNKSADGLAMYAGLEIWVNSDILGGIPRRERVAYIEDNKVFFSKPTNGDYKAAKTSACWVELENSMAYARSHQDGPLSIEDYRNAPSGEGPKAFDWEDKPHRLVYELCREVEFLRLQIRQG